MVEDYIFDKENDRYIVFQKGIQYAISNKELSNYIKSKCLNNEDTNTNYSNILKEHFLQQMFLEKPDDFTRLNYIIRYTYNYREMYKAFDTWYEAVVSYISLKKLKSIYTNIKTNFPVNALIVEAVKYNEELENKIENYEKTNLDANTDISLLD